MELLNCPYCGGKALLINEGKHFTKKYNKKILYARIKCENSDWTNENRCLCKTIAAPIDYVIKHWNNRIEIKTG